MELNKLFSQYYLDKIAKLPKDIAVLAPLYPAEIVNVVDCWYDEPFPEGYIPEIFEIYYGTSDDAHVYIKNGVLQDYKVPNIEGNAPSVSVLFDGNFAYIEIEGREIINKLGGAILPQVTIDASTLVNMLMKGVGEND